MIKSIIFSCKNASHKQTLGSLNLPNAEVFSFVFVTSCSFSKTPMGLLCTGPILLQCFAVLQSILRSRLKTMKTAFEYAHVAIVV